MARNHFLKPLGSIRALVVASAKSLAFRKGYQASTAIISRAVRSEAPDASGLDDALANMHVIEALFVSEKSGRFERP